MHLYPYILLDSKATAVNRRRRRRKKRGGLGLTQYGISTFTSEISLDHLVKSMEVLNRFLEKERKGICVAILITKSNFVFFYLFSSSFIILKTSIPEPRHWILINH